LGGEIVIKCRTCGHDNIAGTLDCDSCATPLGSAPKRGLSARIEEGLISDLAPRPASTISGDATVQAAVEKMRADKVGCVLITEKGAVVGILTERDFLFGVTGIKDPAATKTRDIMHKDPVSLKADDPVSFAFHHMSIGGYRHLPVYDGDKPVGMISARDLLKYLTIDHKSAGK